MDAMPDERKGAPRPGRHDGPGGDLDRRDPYVASVPEAAKLLGISKDLAYDLALRGELPGAFRLGRRWRVSLVRLRAAVHGAEDGSRHDDY
jgi:excisionase family DNA binding protein